MAGPSIHICRSWNANEWSFLANMSAFVPPTYIFHTTASKYLFSKIAIKGIWSHCIEKQYIWKEKFKAEKIRSKAKAIVTDIWQPIWYNINININMLTLSSYMQVHSSAASNLPTTQMGPRDNF